MSDDLNERRSHSRVTFTTPAQLILKKNEGINCTLHDISLGGALVEIPADSTDIKKSAQGELSLSLTETDTIYMQVRVCWHEKNMVGLYCRGIDLDSITHLRRLIELNLGDASLLDRELEALTC